MLSRHYTSLGLSTLALCTVLTPTSLWAQTEPNPNQDRFLQAPDDPVPQPLPPDERLITPTPEADRDPSPPSNTTFLTLVTVNVLGSTVFTAADFTPFTNPLLGTTTLADVHAAVNQITQLYVSQGYLTSQAVLPNQDLSQGVLTIEIVEGHLEPITVSGLQQLQKSYVTSRLGLGVGTPLNVNELEAQLRLLQLDPNLDSLDVVLQSGESLGSSQLLITAQEAKPLFGKIFIDNASARSVGSTRGGMTLGYRNLAGLGDVLSLGYNQTFAGGLDTWNLGYSIPLNPLNGILELTGSLNRNSIITDSFAALGIRGESESVGLSFRQPLLRTAREEFALSLGFTHQAGQTFVFDEVGTAFSVGAEPDGTTKTSVLRFGQDYTRRDANGAWSFRSQFSLGTDLLDATQNSGSNPDGQFLAWLGQVSRVQRLDDTHTLIFQADLQLTGDNLLASEGFSLGGQQTLRGYRQGARNGDNGFRFSIEDRITLLQQDQGVMLLQLAPFVDYGLVWNNPSNPAQVSAEHELGSFGVGLVMQLEDNLTLRLDYGYPIEDVSDRQSDIQDDGLYFNLNYGF